MTFQYFRIEPEGERFLLRIIENKKVVHEQRFGSMEEAEKYVEERLGGRRAEES